MDMFTQEKLIVLFILETIGYPLQAELITDMCKDNDWVNFMVCKHCIHELCESNLIVNVSKNNITKYKITNNGSECLKHFFMQIPLSLRDNIKAHLKENGQQYRRVQDYISDYYKNPDGSYTVILKIINDNVVLMDLKLNVDKKNTAKWLHKNWVEQAPSLYGAIHDTLFN